MAADTEFAIIGGGASAVLLLAALARNPAAEGLRVDLYERSMERLGRGIAYSTPHNVHLLNVRAAHMSAFESDRDDFARWAAERGHDPLSFVPRKVYAEYLNDTFEMAKKKLTLNIIDGDVTGVKKVGKEEYELEYGIRKRSYLFPVLASGNVRPQRPKVEGAVAGYHDDPWSADIAEIAKAGHVGLIGSGLSAVDMILALYAKNFDGKISVFSRHSFIPASHTDPITYPSFIQEGDEKKSAKELFLMIRREVRKAHGEGIPWQAVIDSLRPHTNPIWDAMTKRERENFMKKYFTLWNVHRHRMAPQIAQAMKTLIRAERVEFISTSVDSVSAGPVIRGSGGEFKVDAAINCLGYRVREEGRNFEVAEKIGPARFGEQFETTAIPEIRAQAAEIAAKFLSKF